MIICVNKKNIKKKMLLTITKLNLKTKEIYVD